MEQSVRLRARLVVLIGPIASGKSTVARKLIDQLVSDGFTAARTEVDEMAAMIQAPGGLTIEHWHQAHVVHGALVAGWLGTLVNVVVAEGPIYSRREANALMTRVPVDTKLLRVLLWTSFHSALERVKDDPARGLSRDRQFLQAAHERFWSVRPQIDPFDLTFDTDTETADSIVSRITDRLYQTQGN
jgi:shikimate kinase